MYVGMSRLIDPYILNRKIKYILILTSYHICGTICLVVGLSCMLWDSIGGCGHSTWLLHYLSRVRSLFKTKRFMIVFIMVWMVVCVFWFVAQNMTYMKADNCMCLFIFIEGYDINLNNCVWLVFFHSKSGRGFYDIKFNRLSSLLRVSTNNLRKPTKKFPCTSYACISSNPYWWTICIGTKICDCRQLLLAYKSFLKVQWKYLQDRGETGPNDLIYVLLLRSMRS